MLFVDLSSILGIQHVRNQNKCTHVSHLASPVPLLTRCHKEMAVVFPAPFCPSNAKSCPERISRSNPSSATTLPHRFRTLVSSAKHSCFMVPLGRLWTLLHARKRRF